VKGELGKRVAIYVRAVSETKEYFVRTKSNRLELINLTDFSQSKYPVKNICVQQERQTYEGQSPLPKAARSGTRQW
jgi:hypothetical protein